MSAGSVAGDVVVAVDGSPADRSAVAWAADVASATGRPLLLAHAAGHLPPAMSYAQRHLARRELRARSEQLLHDLAASVGRSPSPPFVLTTTRLLSATALLPELAGSAAVLTRSTDSWCGHRDDRGPVLAAVSDATRDRHVVEFAEEHARRRELADVHILRSRSGGGLARLVRQVPRASLLLVASPGADGDSRTGWRVDWRTVHELMSSTPCPVVLLRPPAVG